MTEEKMIKVGRAVGKSTLSEKTLELVNLKLRDKEMKETWGQAEVNFVFKEIDDARTDKDLKKITVLEYGCGSGKAMEMLRERGVVNIKGIDMSKIAVEYCRRKGLEAYKGDATRDDMPSDFIYGIHLLESVDRETAVKIVTNALKRAKKAIFIISVNSMTEEGIKNLFKSVPYETHRRVEGVVRYTIQGIPWRNDGLVFYRAGGREDDKPNNRNGD